MDKQTENYIGRAVIDRNGQQVGLVDHAHEATDPGDPGWVVVSTGRGRRDRRVVPLRGARTDGPDVIIPVTAQVVDDAPKGKVRAHMTFDEERRLREYYDAASASVGPAPDLGPPAPADPAASGVLPAPGSPPVAPRATTGRNAMIVPAGSHEVQVGHAKAPAAPPGEAVPPAEAAPPPPRHKRRPLRRRFLGGPR